mmetsp:Transcript_11400/g.17133  ORF Transcript_11400/g.17133 Transcript_11400/m.17133 type:complete len:384 (-) Transcript_11400:176-1327(-)|eukprot:CAMPEP_0196814380 /NCGR_PEP_ID=MMETSP1362-20130617/42923_1 /TAXON_ID=163516 /ORGANISM="Leptocylindrus danicus, Strain CCMP1856" /LENGTH=383 /DNA_ID=CAMNT_0042190971 /DNA_START=109 /DNA_END=1260 /DNA_ORIENTATION=+
MASGSNSMPLLWRMLDNRTAAQDWNAVLARIRTHSDEARWCTRFNVSFLHHVLLYFRPPLAIVLALIEVYPASLRKKGLGGVLPLHYAVSVHNEHSPDVVSAILDHYPIAATVKDSSGEIPLRWALAWRSFWGEDPSLAGNGRGSQLLAKVLSRRNVDIVRMLLNAHPAASLENNRRGGGPWQIVAKLWHSNVDTLDMRENLFELTEEILRARFIARSGEGTTSQPLHAIVREKGCDAELRNNFIARYGNQARHHDFTGRFCLHLSIENGCTWENGVKQYYQAAPKAIETRDVRTHLFPFMLAAIGENAEVETIFHLLKEDPSLIQGIKPTKSTRRPWMLNPFTESFSSTRKPRITEKRCSWCHFATELGGISVLVALGIILL